MNLDVSKLRTLAEISALGSMTAAASSLGYTPGAVSQQMAALQRSVGVALFVRVGRRIQLTDAGQVLADHAVRILEAERSARLALASLGGQITAQVRVGVFGTAAAALLPPAIAMVQREHPQVTVRSIEVDVDQATSAVAAAVVDIAFGLDYGDLPIPRSRDVALVGLRTERFRIAVAASRGTKRRTVSLLDLMDEGWVLPPAATQYGLAFRLACRRVGFEPRVVHEVTDTATSMAMVAADLGIAPATDLMLALRSQGILALPLLEDTTRQIVLAYRNNQPPQPGTLATIAAIKRSVSESSPGSRATEP
jgi:DNA-binding transcriptional LysR family regulator